MPGVWMCECVCREKLLQIYVHFDEGQGRYFALRWYSAGRSGACSLTEGSDRSCAINDYSYWHYRAHKQCSARMIDTVKG